MISKRPLNQKDGHWFWSDKNRGVMIKLVIKDSGRPTFFFKLEEGIESGARRGWQLAGAADAPPFCCAP